MTVRVSMTVNGKAVTGEVEERTLLVEFIRNNLRLTGTHVGCDTAQCGACTDPHERPRGEELQHARDAGRGRATLLTIEGVAKPDGTLHPMQEAFREHHGLQCGFCTPGMVMSAIDLAEGPPEARRAGRSARSSTATSAAAPAITTSSRPSRPLAAEGREEAHHGRTNYIGHRSSAARTTASSPAPASTPTTSTLPGQTLRRTSCARRTRTRRSSRSARTRRSRRPGVVAIFTGEDIADAKIGGLPCGWLITDVNGQPMKEPPHPVPRAGQGALRRRPRRRGHRRDARRRRRTPRSWSRSTTRCCPRWSTPPTRASKGAPALHDIAPDNTCYVWGLGDKAAVDKAFAGAAHVTTLEFVNNRLIPNAIEPRAAIALVQPRRRQLHAVRREPEPARRAAADDRVRARACPSTRCASSRPTSAAASARRSTSTPRTWWSPGRRSRSTGR